MAYELEDVIRKKMKKRAKIINRNQIKIKSNFILTESVKKEKSLENKGVCLESFEP